MPKIGTLMMVAQCAYNSNSSLPVPRLLGADSVLNTDRKFCNYPLLRRLLNEKNNIELDLKSVSDCNTVIEVAELVEAAVAAAAQPNVAFKILTNDNAKFIVHMLFDTNAGIPLQKYELVFMQQPINGDIVDLPLDTIHLVWNNAPVAVGKPPFAPGEYDVLRISKNIGSHGYDGAPQGRESYATLAEFMTAYGL